MTGRACGSEVDTKTVGKSSEIWTSLPDPACRLTMASLRFMNLSRMDAYFLRPEQDSPMTSFSSDTRGNCLSFGPCHDHLETAFPVETCRDGRVTWRIRHFDAKANVIKLEHSGIFRNIYTDYREKGEIRPGHQTSSPFFVLFFLFLSFPIFLFFF